MKTVISILFILITGQFTFGQSQAAKIDSIVLAIHNKNPEVAMSIGFIENGKEHYFNYGTINHKDSSKVNEKTIYPIGSITKLFTANLIVQAQEEGKLNVDDYIDDYIPSKYILSKDIQQKIKISDLGSHQSGLPDFDLKQLLENKPKQPLDISEKTIHSILNDTTQLLDYGNYRYSNFSYVLLGIILKKIYLKDFSDLVKEKILNPTNMDMTLTTDFNVKNKVLGYDTEGNEQEIWNWNDLSAPAGLIKSNTLDMVKFLKVILSNKTKVSETTKITEKTFYKNTIREVGFGQQIERYGNDTYYFKTGNTFSGSSIIAYDKLSNWGIIILINQQNLSLIDELINTIYPSIVN